MRFSSAIMPDPAPRPLHQTGQRIVEAPTIPPCPILPTLDQPKTIAVSPTLEAASGMPSPAAVLSPTVQEAEKHDAAGNHTEALNCLARATRAGDIEGKTRLARRLIIGDRAPLLPNDAVRFMAEAAREGSAEAAACMGLLLALGAHVRRNWNDALEAFAMAAERGWEPARTQLCVLAQDLELAAKAARFANVPETFRSAGPADIWKRLAESVGNALTSGIPQRKVLSADPAVHSVPYLITPEVCDWLIEQARPKLARARVYDSAVSKEVTHEARTNTAAIFSFPDVGLVHAFTQARMAAACGLPMQNMEASTVLHYDVGEQITNHYDFVNPKSAGYAEELQRNGQRIVTFLIYLNDGYQGGETDFPRLGFRHRGQRGEGLCFVNAFPNRDPDLRMLHAGRPVLQGEKWIVSQFIRDREFLITRREG